jgi:glycine hydroxymethyltransferase
MLVDLRNRSLTGKEAQEGLDAGGITVNKNAVPFDDKSPLITSGIRIGTPALTTRGMKEPEMARVAQFIDRVLTNPGKPDVATAVAADVEHLCREFPLYPELLQA